MGFTVQCGDAACCICNIDDPSEPKYDLPGLAKELGLNAPILYRLHDRFYETTIIQVATGDVAALHNEATLLQQEYARSIGPTLLKEHGVTATSTDVLTTILDRILCRDATYSAIESFRRLVEQGVRSKLDIQCLGD